MLPHDVWLAGSYAEQAPDRDLPTNTLVVAGPEGTLHRYPKIHPFSYAGEHERFAAGDTLQLQPTAKDRRGHPIPDRSFTYSSSDAEIAAVVLYLQQLAKQP